MVGCRCDTLYSASCQEFLNSTAGKKVVLSDIRISNPWLAKICCRFPMVLWEEVDGTTMPLIHFE